MCQNAKVRRAVRKDLQKTWGQRGQARTGTAVMSLDLAITVSVTLGTRVSVEMVESEARRQRPEEELGLLSTDCLLTTEDFWHSKQLLS